MKITDTITEAALTPNGFWTFKGQCKAGELRNPPGSISDDTDEDDDWDATRMV